MSVLAQVFVQNTGAVSAAAFTDFTAVTTDTISFWLSAGLYESGAGLDINSIVIGSYDVIQIVRGSAGQPLISPRIVVADIKSVNKAVYEVPVAQVYSIPIGVVPAAGGEAIFTLTQRANQSEYPHHGFSFSEVFDAGDSFTNTALIAAVNASSVEITASDGGTGVLTLTADVAGEPFDIGLDGIYTGLTITETSQPDKGVNTAAQILVLEKFASGSWSEYYAKRTLLGPRAEDTFEYPPLLFSDVTTPGTYDTWTIVVKTNAEPSVNRAFGYVEYIIAVEDAVSNEAEIDTFFAAIQVTP